MQKLIHDVYESPAYARGYGKKTILKELTDEQLIDELYKRGVTIERVFAQFFAEEEMGNAKSDELWGNDEEGQHGRPPLTVGDANLAGHGLPKINHEQPF